MIKFGPSGMSEDIKESGITSTIQVAARLKELGADCFEYSFGRGVNISLEKAKEIGDEFKRQGIELSVHAPYYINFATQEEDKAVGNHRYIFDSLDALKSFGGERCVIHPGSQKKMERQEALDIMLSRFNTFLEEKKSLGKYNDLYICVENLGRLSQMGSLDEIIQMCATPDKMIIPCIDFGHLNSRTIGGLKTKENFREVFVKLFDNLPFEKVDKMHIHFSKIEYGDKGEKRHLTFEDQIYGPDFEPLLELIYEYKINPYVICESNGSQTKDSLTMKSYYYSLIS